MYPSMENLFNPYDLRVLDSGKVKREKDIECQVLRDRR
jgi:hypothetical protein